MLSTAASADKARFVIFQASNKDHKDRVMGIYHNNSLSMKYGLQSTVLVTVITEADFKSVTYQQNLFNLLSAYESLGMKCLVLIDFSSLQSIKNSKAEVQYLAALNKRFSKTCLISDLLSADNKPISRSLPTTVTLSDELKSLYVVVRALLEKLIDHADIIFVRHNAMVVTDFVQGVLTPFRGSNTSIYLVPKPENCEFPHTHLDPAWKSVKAVDDFYFIKSNAHTRFFLSNWTDLIVSNKVGSTSSILAALQQMPDATFYRHAFDALTSHHLAYTYLSEFRFQTEDVLDKCMTTQLYRRGALAEFNINEYPTRKLAVPAVIVDVQNPKRSILNLFMMKVNNATLSISSSSSSNGALVLHKIDTEVVNRYVLLSANEELADRLNIYARVEQGSLMALFGQSHIFVVDNWQLRTFPSLDVFSNNNFRWHDVKRYDQNVISHFLRGPDVRENDNIKRSTPIVFHNAGNANNNNKHGGGHHGHKQQQEHTGPKEYKDMNPDERIQHMHAIWVRLANETYDPTRSEVLRRLLAPHAGIYNDKSKATASEELKRTILIHVVSISDDLGSESRYYHMLSNWFCYAQQYGYSPVTYYVPNSNISINQPPRALLQIGIKRENLISYPLHLFWRILSTKTSNIVGNQASYEGELPSFTNHGAIVMLIPLLEALLLGFNVMYFDLDTLMVHDPVPFMMKGNADFTVQLELRNCFYPSSEYFATNIDIANWEFFEPNTGIFFVRSTAKGVKLFEAWMAEIVKRNIMNDQKALDFKLLGAKLSFSCNEQLHYLQNNATFMRQFKNQDKDAPSYCFLNEFLFQNGKIALGCGKGNGGSKSEYLEDMYRQGVRNISGVITQQVPPELRDPMHPVPGINSPVMLHFNYCNDKVVEYQEYGGWLSDIVNNKTICRTFEVSKSSIGGGMDWPAQLQVAMMDLHTAKNKFQNGTLLRLHRRRSTYLMMDGELREIPDQETFDFHKFKHSDIKSVGAYNFVRLIPNGDSLPSMRPPDKRRRMLRHQQMDW